MRTGLTRPIAAAAVLLGAGLSLTVATAAYAHVEVEVEPARAGATDALVAVFPEAHNHNAGAISVQVFPPEGIAPGDVTLVSAPDGWEMTTDDESYTISGDELEIDVSPLHEIRVRQLPDAEEIYFRILTTYSDGQVDRWIEIPSEDNPNPSNAAAGAELAEAEPAPSPTPGPAVTPDPTPSPADPGESDLAGAEDGANTGLLIAIGAALAAVAAVAGWLFVRRRGAGTGDGGTTG